MIEALYVCVAIGHVLSKSITNRKREDKYE